MIGKKVNIELKDCRFGYRNKTREHAVLESVNLRAHGSELISLIGKNGSGKTTFLRTLAGLQAVLSGEIYIHNERINSIPPYLLARKMGFASTVIPDNPQMTVRELVRIGRYPFTNIFGMLNQNDHREIEKAIEICGVADLSKRKLSEISDGERQKAMLARVFAQNTDLILLDEPTSFLDVSNKYEIFSLLRKLSEEGKTVILTTHDLQLAGQYADRIWLINEGRLIDGAPEDLFLKNEMIGIFSSDKVSMDSLTGEIEPKFSERAKLILRVDPGCENAEYWTLKALRRKGFSVLREDSDLSADLIHLNILKKTDKFIWNLRKENQNLFFTNIYQLISQIQKMISHELN